ncbi:hypothetical protein HG535_0C00260 [Zygotorulaspora mrakii]|uniref:Cystathionine gamma-synthase n=1 Tax=Zygotorulaspora mrakii TaxID=42260 RepID=A0A7H9AZ36_ZYGMR|nr:uncharacterized protein HG535_0C00260 [Zygotorulaspora mrakii]QLG71678.1 hypothetical protein HG535_0C00260 [Zygotorulaspora mrakii]
MTEIDFGQPLPSNLEYAVSFGIPTWRTALGYVEKDPIVIEKMATGYPRYFPQPPIQKLCKYFVKKFGKNSEDCRPFPSLKEAEECLMFIKSVTGSESTAHLAVDTFKLADNESAKSGENNTLCIRIAAVLAAGDEFNHVKEYWKLRGECVSSRLADLLSKSFMETESFSSQVNHGLEERVLSAQSSGENAKILIKRRIADNHFNPFGSGKNSAALDVEKVDPEKVVYLVSSGMSSIFTARRFLTHWEESRASKYSSSHENTSKDQNTSVCNTAAIFGFPFKDTQVILRTFGTCKFYGFGDSRDIDSLKNYLDAPGNRILAVFIETPSNPLLNMPDLKKLRKLADKYGFFIVIDDTIGGLNVDVLGYADIICTSLTKLFNGSSNVMGGSVILNPQSSIYSSALDFFSSHEFEELLWLEDAVVLEENSRDFEDRTIRANENTEKLIYGLLLAQQGDIFKKIYYPALSSKETFENYEAVRNEKGGYGCLFSMSFFNELDAGVFYDSLKVFKGPSNGTNFTLACPYVQLAHHSELEEVSEFGADPNFVRVSVGLEDSKWLIEVFSAAIEAVKQRYHSKV